MTEIDGNSVANNHTLLSVTLRSDYLLWDFFMFLFLLKISGNVRRLYVSRNRKSFCHKGFPFLK